MKKPSDFKTKKEFFQYLVANKQEIIDLKKTLQKFTDPFGKTELQIKAIKTLNTSYQDDVASGSIKRTIIGNTYNWMDSHNDVHGDNCFASSIEEREGKIFHLHDHKYEITARVGKPISIYEKKVDWSDLGVDKAGKTMALFMDSQIKKELNPIVFNLYVEGEVNQHSVAMSYIELALALNDSEFKEEYALWKKIIGKLGNREKAEKQGFFWYVSIAGLYEISGVLVGSNELTPTVENNPEEKKEDEPVELKQEPSFLSKLVKQFQK